MENKELNLLKDSRVKCTSLLLNMRVGEYLELIDNAYKNKGGLPYQRDALKTTSGRRIRNRMIQDIIKGTILPPLVAGVVISEKDFDGLDDVTGEITNKIKNDWSEHISIIDGMQRTTALKQAVDESAEVSDSIIRVEFWISKSTSSLIYRMLVLNTGQVPWNLKRQLQVVYSPLIDEMNELVKFKRLFTLDSQGRRRHGGEYRAEDLVETYLSFGLRKTEIDTQETLADEFSRLDMADAISNDKYKTYFYPILQSMVDIDLALSRLDTQVENIDVQPGGKYTIGRHIFDTQPARIGYIVACAISVLGRIGMDKPEEESKAALDKILKGGRKLIEVLNAKTNDELHDFLGLDVLSEKIIGQKRSAIGRHERAFFEVAFKTLIEEGFAVPKLEACWRA
ncbi:Uncharacterised protein [Serratia quinivorans]|uniref:hypothetical protein n=1 Tax=Serratia quinivorans TaxID=137545 RepID=UPI000F6FF2F4|nr:hypothetical protein [Serratia quinivorans]VEI68433.1 Uncharacterised protein [Serratia quinivorans]